jgi:hypothetical protein
MIELTDAQIVRLMELCTKVVAIKREVPLPPPGVDVSLQIAQLLRASLGNLNDTLVELGALLR